jgi:hypothetical protein
MINHFPALNLTEVGRSIFDPTRDLRPISGGVGVSCGGNILADSHLFRHNVFLEL